MAIQTPQGYLISVDTVTIINHSTLRAKDIARDTAVVNVPSYVIPTQVKIYYNGTDNSTVTPGTITQDVICTSGGITLLNTLRSKKGHYVPAVFSPLSGTDLNNSGVVVLDVVDNTPMLKRDGDIHFSVIIDIFGEWT